MSSFKLVLAAALIGFVVACDPQPAADTGSEAVEPDSPTPFDSPIANRVGSPDAPGSSNEARTEHTATLMPDGTILAVAGDGEDDELTSAEYYDPETGLWTPVGSISTPRAGHTATLLPDGRVLIAGGGVVGSVTSSTELYDPGSESWTVAAPLSVPRIDHTATLLADGRVLVAGGSDKFVPTPTTEIYDPTSGVWASGPDLAVARAAHTATLLPDGRVLLTGGKQGREAVSSVEIYDPVSSSWTSAPPMSIERAEHTATLLPALSVDEGPDGRILVIGGRDGSIAHESTEIFDPVAQTWATGASMRHSRGGHTATLLTDGRVIVVGGGGAIPSNTAEVFDPYEIGDDGIGVWTRTDNMLAPRRGHTATLLPSGSLIVAGGKAGLLSPLTRTELYVPGSGAWATAGSTQRARWGHVAVLMQCDGPDPCSDTGAPILLGGYDMNGRSMNTAEFFHGGIRKWVQTEPMSDIRWGHAVATLPGGRIAVAGGVGHLSTPLASAEVLDPAAAVWDRYEDMADARSRHTLTLLPALSLDEGPAGTLMAAGGWDGINALSSVEILDPLTGRWTPASPMRTPRWGHTATVLDDGRVLIAGGVGSDDRSVSSSEIYDPTTGTWTDAGNLVEARDGHVAVALSDGRVLAVGGYGAGGVPTASTEIFDPASGTWSAAGQMSEPRAAHTATLLPDGRVLVVGGSRDGITPLSTAELFTFTCAALSCWTPGGAIRDARWGHSALLMDNGTVQIVGGFGFSALQTVETYTPMNGGWYSGERLS